MSEFSHCKWFYPLDFAQQDIAICLHGETQYKQITWHDCDACKTFEVNDDKDKVQII